MARMLIVTWCMVVVAGCGSSSGGGPAGGADGGPSGDGPPAVTGDGPPAINGDAQVGDPDARLTANPEGGGNPDPAIAPRFEVTWAPEAKVIEAADGLAHLMGPAPKADTTTYTFDAQAAAIAALQPGDIAVLTGIAYRRVVSVETTPAGIQLTTERTTLPAAIQAGTLAWSKPVDFSPAVMKSLTVEYGGQPLDVVAQAQTGALSYEGDLEGGWHASVTLTPSAGRLMLAVAVGKTVLGERRFALTGNGYLQGFTADGEAVIDAGGISFRAGSHEIEGEVHVTAAAFNTGASQELLNLPLGIDIPIEVGPVPLLMKVKMNVNVTLELMLAETSAQATVSFHFRSNQAISASSVTSALEFSSSSGSGTFADFAGGSAATVAAGMAACVEVPRIELSMLGEFASVGFSQNNCASTTFTFDPACNEVRGSIVGQGLANLGFFGITLASASAELYNLHRRISRGSCGPE